MKGFSIFIATVLLTFSIYTNNIDHNIAMAKRMHAQGLILTHQEIAQMKDLVTEKEKERLLPVPDYSFCYLEFTAFPTKLEHNTFGVALGYRVSEGENSASDYSFHVMRNACKEIIIAGKANHLFYAVEKKNMFAPYIGFGLMFGVAPEHDVISKEDGHYVHRVKKESEYRTMMDGELVAGVEYMLNNTTRQFFELTYFAHTSILQLSLGLGF